MQRSTVTGRSSHCGGCGRAVRNSPLWRPLWWPVLVAGGNGGGQQRRAVRQGKHVHEVLDLSGCGYFVQETDKADLEAAK